MLPSRDDVRAALPRAAQTAITAAVAWQICRWLGADRPVFAAIVPIVAIKGDPLAALNVSLGRLFGVVGGIALGIVVADVGGANAVTVALLIGAGLIAGLLIRIGGEPNSQVAVSALLVLAVATGAGAFGLERLWETAIGAAVTVVLAPFLWPPDPVRELERRLAARRRPRGRRHRADPRARRRAGRRRGGATCRTSSSTRARRPGSSMRSAPPAAACASTPAAAELPSAWSGSRRGCGSRATSRTGRAAWRVTSRAWPRARTSPTPGRRPPSRRRPPARPWSRPFARPSPTPPTGGDRLRAEAALDRWRDLDTSAVAVVLRRDLRTLLEDAIPVGAAAARVP